ncbi:MAG: hypothetical protein ACE5HW_06570 [Candidatus Methanofastidiosia archaeon]
MAKYRKAPRSEWLAYPVLSLEDVEQEFFGHSRYLAKSLVENRKGRVHVIFDNEFYEKFLECVKERFGDISSKSVNKAVLDAIKIWMEG